MPRDIKFVLEASPWRQETVAEGVPEILVDGVDAAVVMLGLAVLSWGLT